MDLVEFGVFMLERAENAVVATTLRCLGFSALSLEALLDEVQDNGASARWGVEDEPLETL